MKPRIKSMIWNIRQEKTTTQKKKKKFKNEDSTNGLWDNVKRSNILLKRSQKEKGKSKKLETYLKK